MEGGENFPLHRRVFCFNISRIVMVRTMEKEVKIPCDGESNMRGVKVGQMFWKRAKREKHKKTRECLEYKKKLKVQRAGYKPFTLVSNYMHNDCLLHCRFYLFITKQTVIICDVREGRMYVFLQTTTLCCVYLLFTDQKNLNWFTHITKIIFFVIFSSTVLFIFVFFFIPLIKWFLSNLFSCSSRNITHCAQQWYL